MTVLRCWFLATLALCAYLPPLSAGQPYIVSTESDPDAFVQNSVNAINGDYCESTTDLVITGPDALVLQRFYSTKDAMTGTQLGGWRVLPQRFLVMGRDASGKSYTVGEDRFEWTSAFVGERSGGIITCSGWRNTNGTTKDPLRIDVLNNACGMVNTYAGEINGQTNHQNNLLHCKGDTCELILGDGTKRIYQKMQHLPSLFLGEELTPLMARQMIEPEFFLLDQEILPSGNQLFFSYDPSGHLISIEMKNNNLTKTFSWIHLSYERRANGCQIHIETSDARELVYHLALDQGIYQLMQVTGSHCAPVSYEYKEALIKKNLPQGRFIAIDYEGGKVQSIKGPHAQSGAAEIVYSFFYGDSFTDVFNAAGLKTRYIYDKRLQLTVIERYDEQNRLYRIEQKFWGKTEADAGLLLAKTIGDGSRCVHSYRSFRYDQSGNVIEERLYGNLTGKEGVFLQVSSDGQLLNPDQEECDIKTFGYSTNGLNLLTKIGDCKGNQTLYFYKPGTNLLAKKLIFDKGVLKKRTFQFYNADAVCIKIIEDDGTQEGESRIYGGDVTERHIKEMKPKETYPGVGLSEMIEEKAVDLKKRKEVLIKKLVNVYDNQSNLLSCRTYDANGEYAFVERRAYNGLGQVISHIDAAGREVHITYDEIGNQISVCVPQDNKVITTTFDFHNQPIAIRETTAEGQFTINNTYDSLGRKVCSTDRFGNPTQYEYDAFHRLTKVIYPEVLDENNKIIRPTFSYTYDFFGNVVAVTDAKGYVTKKSYNLRGDPTKISYPDGSFELFKYDSEGSLHRSLTREQIITVYEYDYLGRLIYQERSTAGEAGVSAFLTNKFFWYNGFRCIREEEGDFVKRYGFDPAGRLSSIVTHANGLGSQGRMTELMYDSVGRLRNKKILFDSGQEDYALECFEYDPCGNVVEKRVEDARGAILLKKGFSYNLQGNCIEEYTLENGVKTSLISTFYNAEEEPIRYLDGYGNETNIIFDYSYQNRLGQTVLKKTLVNPVGVCTEIEFDTLSRICFITKKDSLDVLLSRQKNTYDSLGNKTCEIHDQIADGKILGSYQMQWIYGPMGRVEEEVKGADSPQERRTRYSYNSLGQVTNKSIAGIAASINYTYHKEGTLRTIDVQDGKKELQISNRYLYDRKGNVVSAYSLEASVYRTYDVFNQLVKETIKDEGGTYTLQYVYDKKERLKDVILPDNSKITYTYDAVFGRKVQRISAQGEVLYSHTYDQYDRQGRLQNESCVGYVGSREYSYDLNGRKISSKNDFLNEQYARDVLGHLLEVKGEVKGHQHKEYAYNALSQLTLEKTISPKTYAYDSLGNRVQADDDNLLYNALNQLTSYSNTEFSYDINGNLLRKVLEGEETRFESNLLSQLISIEKADQTTLTFSYDPFGRLLVEKHLDTKGKNKKTLSTLRYFYLGPQEIGSLTEAGDFETLKIPGLHGDELAVTSIAFEIRGETYVPLHDIVGNVVGLIDPQTRQRVESYQYTAFGEETIYNSCGEVEAVSIMGNPWRFAEKRVGQQSGLIFFGMRFYDSTTGRWISQDPAGLIDGPNLYAYLHNNPLNYLDRFGFAAETNSPHKFEKYFYGEVETHCYCEKHRTCKRGGNIGKTASANLPKITYSDYFEKFYKDYRNEDLFIKNFYKDSTYYDLSGEGVPNLPSDLGIGFINGIWNDFESAEASTQYLSKLAGGYNVHAVYNATHGRGVDVYECGLGLNYIATEPVRQLHKMWNSFFEISSANAKFLMICHSQGAMHVRNALLDYPPELRERILVVAIAPAAYVYKETCAQVIHYRVEGQRDFVPRLDRAGAQREKDTIITLASHPGACVFNHEFMSFTYQSALRKRIKKYINTNGKTLCD